jgi:hypothetical protein
MGVIGFLALCLCVLGIWSATRTSGGLKQEDAVEVAPRPPAQPLTGNTVFWAVFGALWAFSLTAGILYALIRLLLF